jgi:hypothetical protein
VAAKRLGVGKIDPWIYFSPDRATQMKSTIDDPAAAGSGADEDWRFCSPVPALLPLLAQPANGCGCGAHGSAAWCHCDPLA